MLSEPANSVSPTPVPGSGGADVELKATRVLVLQVGILRGDEECKAVHAIIFFR